MLRYKVVVKDTQQETVDLGFELFGTYKQSVPVILKKLMLPDGFNSISPRLNVINVTTELFELRINSHADPFLQGAPVSSTLQVYPAIKTKRVRNPYPGSPPG